MLTTLEVGLCAGRHELKNSNGEIIDAYIFDEPIENPLDFEALETTSREFISRMELVNVVKLYITGLTPALTSFLLTWRKRMSFAPVRLIMMHYNRDTGGYEPQEWS
tara:strand:+ start:354 stop:674 length:321 start_codon:yes stop_codon:yes gene_type:complete